MHARSAHAAVDSFPRTTLPLATDAGSKSGAPTSFAARCPRTLSVPRACAALLLHCTGTSPSTLTLCLRPGVWWPAPWPCADRVIDTGRAEGRWGGPRSPSSPAQYRAKDVGMPRTAAVDVGVVWVVMRKRGGAPPPPPSAGAREHIGLGRGYARCAPAPGGVATTRPNFELVSLLLPPRLTTDFRALFLPAPAGPALYCHVLQCAVASRLPVFRPQIHSFARLIRLFCYCSGYLPVHSLERLPFVHVAPPSVMPRFVQPADRPALGGRDGSQAHLNSRVVAVGLGCGAG